MKIIFLDFDGVMDTEYYDHILSEAGKPISDEYGLLFDPECVKNLKYIIDNTGADIVVSSTWKEDIYTWGQERCVNCKNQKWTFHSCVFILSLLCHHKRFVFRI